MIRLGYVIHYVADVPATVAFYECAFGLERRFIHDSGQYGEMATGATVLAFADEALATLNGLSIRPGRPGRTAAAVEIAFVTDDPGAAFARAVAAGASPLVEPVAKPWGQVVGYVADLNGFLVEICSAVTG